MEGREGGGREGEWKEEREGGREEGWKDGRGKKGEGRREGEEEREERREGEAVYISTSRNPDKGKPQKVTPRRRSHAKKKKNSSSLQAYINTEVYVTFQPKSDQLPTNQVSEQIALNAYQISLGHSRQQSKKPEKPKCWEQGWRCEMKEEEGGV